jgi:multidrug resistance efflux pump
MKHVGLAVGLVLGIFLAAGAQETPPKSEAAPGKPEAKPETAPAKRETMKVELKLDGTFEPAERHVVQIKTQAWTGEMAIAKLAPHGSKVQKGDVLLQIDGAKLHEAIAAAGVDLASARIQLDRVTEEIKLAAAGESIQKERVERDAREAAERLKYFSEVEMALELADLELNKAWAEDSIADQKEELDQIEKMYKSEELTNATRDIVLKRAQRSLERSKTRYELFMKRYERIKSHDLPRQLEDWTIGARERAHGLESWMKTSPIQKADRETNLARTTTAVRQQEENLAKLRKDETALTIIAVADGVVWYGSFADGNWQGVEEAQKNLKVGEKIQANQPLMTLVPAELCVKTAVAEDRLGDLPVGTFAKVTPVAFPDLALEGKAAAPVLVGMRKGDAFDTRINLAAGDPRLVPGLKAKIVVKVAELKDVVTVPAGAVSEEDGKKVVKVLEGGKPVTREVTVGRAHDGRTEIKSGVNEGDEVVTGGGAGK